MKEQINKTVITGTGCVTNIGLCTDEYCMSLEYILKERSKRLNSYDINDFRFFDTELLKKNYRLDIACQYILSSVEQALQSAKIVFTDELYSNTRIAIIIGSSLGLLNNQSKFLKALYRTGEPSSILFSQTANNLLSGIIAYKYKLKGLNFTLYNGWTSSLDAISIGKRLLENGKADMVIAGGVDTLGKINCNTLKSTCNSMGYGKIHNGNFHVCDGAGVVILESEKAALYRNADIQGYVGETYQKRANGYECLRNILADIFEENKEIKHYFANQNGTTFDKFEMNIVYDYIDKNKVINIKKCIGECGAASGILQIIYSLYLRSEKSLVINICNTGRLSGVEIYEKDKY